MYMWQCGFTWRVKDFQWQPVPLTLIQNSKKTSKYHVTNPYEIKMVGRVCDKGTEPD